MTTRRNDSSIKVKRELEKLRRDASIQLDKILKDSALSRYKVEKISTTGLRLSRRGGLKINIEMSGSSYRVNTSSISSYIDLESKSEDKEWLTDIGRLLSDKALIRKMKKTMDRFIEESIRLDEEIAQIAQNMSNKSRAETDEMTVFNNKQRLLRLPELQTCSKVVVRAYESRMVDTGLVARDKPVEIVDFYEDDILAYSDVVRLNNRTPKKAEYSYMDVNSNEIRLQ